MSAARILVVEDEAIIAYDLERTLQRLGYDVPEVVAEGEAAIEAAARHAPSLVLMDIKLRGALDGVDAARAIRERLAMPVVFLTSHSDLATLSRAASAQPEGYVMKPFVERDLHVAIEVAIRKHEVERALRHRERWFSTTLQCVGDGVVATDEGMAVSYLNRAAEALTGWRPEEALGRPLEEVLRLQDRHGAPLRSPAARALASGAAVTLDDAATLVSRDGARRLVDDSAAPIIDERGKLLGVVVVVRDVTERKGMETQLARAERLVALGTLAAGICHEINNPLTHVIESIEWGLRTAGDEGASAAVTGVLDEARESAVRIGKIVQGVRTFAQPGPELRRRVSLRDVVDAAAKLTASELRARARFRLVERPAPEVFADPDRLIQVFVNLLLNAAQAIPAGSPGAHEITVSLDETPVGGARAVVRDDGPGIDPEVLPRIFDPFFTTKSPGNGMGLGLSISSSIVRGYDGEISAESAPGQGTAFTVTLPAATPPAPPEAQPSARPVASTATRGRVLLIDDEEIVARSLARALSEQHEVERIGDAREALARLLDGPAPDAVLCDVMMPDMTGIELYEVACARRPALAPRFVFLTAGATSEEARAFLADPDRRVVYKPIFDVSKLRALVARVVDRARAG